MRFLATIVAISAIAVGAFAVPAPLATTFPSTPGAGNGTITGNVNTFIDSCNTLYVWQYKTDVYLGANCQADDHQRRYSSLNLNHCVTNRFGSMEARAEGQFGQSCRGMVQHGVSYMYGYCSNGKYDEYTAIDLRYFIENTDGHLNCFGFKDEVVQMP
ncbi:hypothetical protein HD806DRAFT_475576 [Xylariaceae sp. AK1471]|nr:hypothetical protein HD806DRAFT_475576 [Xylariaceae sp. AK1471]